MSRVNQTTTQSILQPLRFRLQFGDDRLVGPSFASNSPLAGQARPGPKQAGAPSGPGYHGLRLISGAPACFRWGAFLPVRDGPAPKPTGGREFPAACLWAPIAAYCTPLLTARTADAPVGKLAVAVSVVAWPELT